MADDTVSFELASPESLLVSEDVDMVVVPGSEGDFGVLPGHAPFISTVRPGVINIYQGDRIDQRIFVSDGFAEVNERGCIVLSSEARAVDAIDRTQTDERLKSAEDALRDADTDSGRARAEAEIAVCNAMLRALE